MLGACVSRLQYAVGHGGFHMGHIQISELARTATTPVADTAIENFRYVYDCGSEQSDAFKSALNTYRLSSGGRTDILFVSHLHSDHINGIERLQAMAPAATAVVPHLDVIDRLIFVLADTEAGAISLSAREYFANPASWWQARGARQVIFLEADDGDVPQPGGPTEPDAPVGRDDSGDISSPATSKEEAPSARLAYHLRKPRGSVPHGLTAADEAKRDLTDGPVIAGAGSFIQLEWRHIESMGWRVGDWILLPYVHPVEKAIRSRFQRAVMKALQIKGRNEGKLLEKLVEHLVSHEKTKVLLGLYNEHFEGDHNALSMSLYSGPYCRSAGTDDASRRWHSYGWLCTDFPHHYLHSSEAVGWLGTGDSALKQERRRDPWINFYEPYSSNIRVLTLPHHGSKHNFHSDILAFDGLTMVLATTVEHRERVAGMRNTLDFVEAQGIHAHVVDDQRTNCFRFYCKRIMKT